MTCKDCLCKDVCFYIRNAEDVIAEINPLACTHFKPKSRFVELPCEAGTKVAVIASKTSDGKNLYIFEDIVDNFVIVEGFVFIGVENHLSIPNYNWHNVFFGENAREDAEKALAERSK